MRSHNFVVVLFVVVVVVLVAIPTKAQLPHQDAAVMAHVVGSGAMNVDHYFHTLGVACENRNLAFWKNIQQDRTQCMATRGGDTDYYATLPKGSFEKMCRNWKRNEVCNINFGRDLNQCLDRTRGSDALEFMEAYANFACRDVRDTENQLAVHTRRHAPIVSPGVFKCFPELQDRILNCVKTKAVDTYYAHSLCSQFYTVQQCFARFYTDSKSCDHTGVVDYLRDLFKSMAYTMKCSGTEHVWDDNSLSARPPPTPRPNAYRQDAELPRYRPLSVPYNNFPAFRDIQAPQPIRPPVQLFNNQQFAYPSRDDQFAYPRGSDSIPLNLQNSGEPPPPVRFWKAVPLQTPPPMETYPAPPQRPSSSSPRSQSQLKSQQEDESPLGKWFNLQQKKYSSPTSGGHGPAWAWGYERYAQPGNGGGGSNMDMDKFYSYRVEQNNQERDNLNRGQGDNSALNRGVYDLYKVHYDTRYGLPPRSRGLTNRNPKSKVDGQAESPTLDDLHDNHFRKFKDDHFFQIQTTPKSTLRFIHSAPTLVSTRRTVKDVTPPKTVENNDIDDHSNYRIIILSNTTVAPNIRVMVKGNDHGVIRFPAVTLPPPGYNFTFHNNPPQFFSTRKPPPPLTKIIVTEGPALSYNVVQQRRTKYDRDNFPTTTPPSNDDLDRRRPSSSSTSSPRTFRFRNKNDKTLHQFSWHTSTTRQNDGGVVTPRYHLSPSSSNKNYTFPPWPRSQRPVLISTTMPPQEDDEPLPPSRPNKILRRVKVRKRPTTTTTTEFSTTDNN